jgi:hypothetical protein
MARSPAIIASPERRRLAWRCILSAYRDCARLGLAAEAGRVVADPFEEQRCRRRPAPPTPSTG